LSRHGLDFIHRQVQLGGKLLIGKVQAHEVQAQDPNFQRQMMPFKDGSRQIIKLFATSLTAVALAVSLMSMKAAFTDPLRLAKQAVNALRPADFADFFVSLMFVNR
jgi:acetoacetate decarboxylase